MIVAKTFGESYENGYTRTVHLLLSKGFSLEVAEESAQAAWVRGWERRGQLRQISSTLPWVNAIALNIARNQLRRENRLEKLGDWFTRPESLDVAVEAEQMLAGGSQKDRILLEKRYVEGWDICELAQNHQCTRVAIRVRLFRARSRLRDTSARMAGDSKMKRNVRFRRGVEQGSRASNSGLVIAGEEPGIRYAYGIDAITARQQIVTACLNSIPRVWPLTCLSKCKPLPGKPLVSNMRLGGLGGGKGSAVSSFPVHQSGRLVRRSEEKAGAGDPEKDAPSVSAIKKSIGTLESVGRNG